MNIVIKTSKLGNSTIAIHFPILRSGHENHFASTTPEPFEAMSPCPVPRPGKWNSQPSWRKYRR